jgi:hypothetical protein
VSLSVPWLSKWRVLMSSIWGLNRLLGMYFSRQRHAEGTFIPTKAPDNTDSVEKHLRKLLAEQRKQLDAIKKATNYDSTRKLIELYDEHSPASASPSPQQLPQRSKQVSSNPVTPVRQVQAPVPGLGPGPSKPSPKGTPRAPGHLVGVGGTPQAGQSTPSPSERVRVMLMMKLYQEHQDKRECRPNKLLRYISTCRLFSLSSPPRKRNGTTES